jgi:hypothetical protein
VNYLIDITADQFNLLEPDELNENIILFQPLEKVYCGLINTQPHSSLFKRGTPEVLTPKFNSLAPEFIESMELTYKVSVQLSSTLSYSRSLAAHSTALNLSNHHHFDDWAML